MVGIWSILYHLSQEMVQTLTQSLSPTLTFVSFIRFGAGLGNHVGCIAEKKKKTVDNTRVAVFFILKKNTLFTIL